MRETFKVGLVVAAVQLRVSCYWWLLGAVSRPCGLFVIVVLVATLLLQTVILSAFMFSSWHYVWYASVYLCTFMDDCKSAFFGYDVHLIALLFL